MGARTKLSEDVLDLGERLLNRVQVRRIGWYEHQFRTPRFDEFPYPLGPVRSEVVHHHYLSLRKGWCQKVLDVDLEGSSVCGSLYAHRLSHPMEAHRGDQREVLAPVLGYSPVCSHSPGSSRPQAIHRDMRPALIYEHKTPNIEASYQPSPQSSRSLVAFLGYLRLFLSGHPPGSLRILRLIVASETSTPVSSKKASQCSLKVRSGLDFSCSGSHSLKAWPFSAGLPGIFIV